MRFEMELKVEVARQCHCMCTLLDLLNPGSTSQAQSTIQTRITKITKNVWTESYSEVTTNLKYVCCTVVLNRTGARLTLQSTEHPPFTPPYNAVDKLCANASMNLPFTGRFPWVFSFYVRRDSVDVFRQPILLLTIHPPTL